MSVQMIGQPKWLSLLVMLSRIGHRTTFSLCLIDADIVDIVFYLPLCLLTKQNVLDG